MKIAYQGIPGSYSESCAKQMYPECETISCKTFDECFEKAKQDNSIRSIIYKLKPLYNTKHQSTLEILVARL